MSIHWSKRKKKQKEDEKVEGRKEGKGEFCFCTIVSRIAKSADWSSIAPPFKKCHMNVNTKEIWQRERERLLDLEAGKVGDLIGRNTEIKPSKESWLTRIWVVILTHVVICSPPRMEWCIWKAWSRTMWRHKRDILILLFFCSSVLLKDGEEAHSLSEV